MSKRDQTKIGPHGALRTEGATQRPWRWNGGGLLESAPVRCRKAQWYLARAALTQASGVRPLPVVARFLRDEQPIAEVAVALSAVGDPQETERLGWVLSPEDATHLQLLLPPPNDGAWIAQLDFHPVAERDPKCHPLANVPRWSQQRPPIANAELIVPASLAALVDRVPGVRVRVEEPPTSLDKLGRRARGRVCVLDADWIRKLRIQWRDLQPLAARSCIVLDLACLTSLLQQAIDPAIRLTEQRDPHGLMSARVEYSDFMSRGFALKDAFPYGVFVGGQFGQRAILSNRAWKKFANAESFATIFASETPWEKRSGHVLCAAHATGTGELVATDLPGLAALDDEDVIAPRIARHLVAMLCGVPLDDAIQYWNRWDDALVVVRDIADMQRRCIPLQTVRWLADEPHAARLGLSLIGGRPQKHVLISTGRIDATGVHDGVPPEPMQIFMKWLAREAREQTDWYRRHADQLAITWQFDVQAGLKYASQYDSATRLPRDLPLDVIRIAMANESTTHANGTMVLEPPGGVLGDGAFAFQTELTRRLRAAIEGNT